MKSDRFLFSLRHLIITAIFFAAFLLTFPHQSHASHCNYNGTNGFNNGCNVQYHQQNNAAGSCLACLGFDETTGYFSYQMQSSHANFVGQSCPAATLQEGAVEYFQLQQNSNVDTCYIALSMHPGCNNGFNCGDGPTVTPGGGGCPPNCPSPTPTPTPTPYCTLSCSGQGGIGVGGGAGSMGTGDGEPVPTGFEPPETVGQIVYNGFNGFICGLFKDGLGFNGACPDPGVGNTFSQPIRYHMLCGGSQYTYKSQVDSASGGGGGIPQPTPTSGPLPTIGLYPPGCVLNPSIFPTPTIIIGDPGGGGGSGNANFCSCLVTLGCQTQLYPPTSSGCDASCDMVFIPDNPVYSEAMGVAITGTPTSLSFDDGTTPIPNPAPSIAHTFANAGVYRTQLVCGGTTCQKTLNVYCSYIPKMWYKLKDSALNKWGEVQNPIPATPIAFDGDDTNDRQLIISQGGLVTAPGTINVGTGTASARDWKRENYTQRIRFTPTFFLEYVKSRKQYVNLVDSNGNGVIDNTEITGNAINVAPTGNFTIDSNSIQSKSPFVLIIQGNATINIINNATFNPPDKSLAILATGTLKIDSHMEELNGIFIANMIDFANDIPVGQWTTNLLKINGNLLTMSQSDPTKRQGTLINKPSIFIVSKLYMHLDLLPMLSTSQYQWVEQAP